MDVTGKLLKIIVICMLLPTEGFSAPVEDDTAGLV